MRENGGHRTGRSKSAWRALAVALALLAGWMLPASASGAQPGAGARARACNQLQAALRRIGNRQAPRQALLSAMNRLGCNGSPTTTAVPATTTTSTLFVDCPLPGGGVGPCPTSTITTVSPPTTQPGDTTTTGPSTTLVPCTTTTTSQGVPTTIPCQQ